MQKINLLTALLIGVACMANAQGTALTFSGQNRSTQPASKATLIQLIEQSNALISKPGENPADLDQAIQLANQAKKTSLQLSDKAMFNEALLAIGRANAEKRDARPAFALLAQMNDTTRIRMLRSLGGYYFNGVSLTKSLDSAVFCVSKAIAMAKAGGFVQQELAAREEIIIYYSRTKNWTSALEHMIATLGFKHLMKPEDIPGRYFNLCVTLYNAGEFDLSLKYVLEGKGYAEKQQNTRVLLELDEFLASIYVKINEHQKAVEIYDVVLDGYKRTKNYKKAWAMLEWQSTSYVRLSKPEEGLQTVIRTEKELGCPDPAEQFSYKRILAKLYVAMEQHDLAEKYFNESLDLAPKVGREDAVLYNSVTRFYISRGLFEKARPFAVKALSLQYSNVPGVLSGIYQNLYKIDSATQQYASALSYYIKRQYIEDSMAKADKTKQMQSLLVQFETEKKDKDLKLKNQEILLLGSQHQLQQKDLERARLQVQYESEAKQQGIQLARAEAAEKDKSLQLKNQDLALLRKETLIKENNLSQANFTRNITIVGAGLLLIILLLVYYQYRLKKQMSITLEGKNLALGHLLKEKEILLKEVHHRVKNNLHTIISLLETQSAFLTDDALAAIQNSQHRVYAMSLIHQKLYQVDNSTSVSMSTYLPELISYLKDSFVAGRQINFRTQIDDIDLDVSQAIPIGLILNEAITNAIKYAFPGGRPGEITITMTQDRERQVCLTVADNGIGIPAGWQSNTGSSLGLKLMQGLSGDIQGSFNMESAKGTSISVTFKRETYSQTRKQHDLS